MGIVQEIRQKACMERGSLNPEFSHAQAKLSCSEE